MTDTSPIEGIEIFCFRPTYESVHGLLMDIDVLVVDRDGKLIEGTTVWRQGNRMKQNGNLA